MTLHSQGGHLFHRIPSTFNFHLFSACSKNGMQSTETICCCLQYTIQACSLLIPVLLVQLYIKQFSIQHPTCIMYKMGLYTELFYAIIPACFLTFCCSAIPTSFNVFYTCTLEVWNLLYTMQHNAIVIRVEACIEHKYVHESCNLPHHWFHYFLPTWISLVLLAL